MDGGGLYISGVVVTTNVALAQWAVKVKGILGLC